MIGRYGSATARLNIAAAVCESFVSELPLMRDFLCGSVNRDYLKMTVGSTMHAALRCITLLCCMLSACVLSRDLAVAEVYLVGPGDVLSITVYDQPDLSVTVRVSGEGSILVPLIGQVQVSGKSVSHIAKELETRFADGFLVNPHVNVFVEEFQGRKAVVLGQVNKPGMVELKGPITLLELISRAGGLTDSAGSTAVIRRTGPDGAVETIKVDLKKLLNDGDLSMNIPIEDRDHVFIDKVEQYIMGEVRQPGPYLMHRDHCIEA